MYLLDTDICIAIARRRSSVHEQFESIPAQELSISVITHGELLLGVEKASSRTLASNQLKMLLARLTVLPLTSAVSATYARVRSKLELQGQIIGTNDLWIAAHALTLNLTLVTNNEREFRRIPELRIENWLRTG